MMTANIGRTDFTGIIPQSKVMFFVVTGISEIYGFLRFDRAGIVVFASTNIDDIFVLMMFFSDRSFTSGQVILGQYFGIGLLIGISAVGALVALVVPPTVVGLLGFLPIAIGVKKLLDLYKGKPDPEANEPAVQPIQNRGSLRFLTVTAVTFSNGGDNIGVYVPLFANGTTGEMAALIMIFLAMVAIWCAIGYYLVNHSFVGGYIRRVGTISYPSY